MKNIEKNSNNNEMKQLPDVLKKLQEAQKRQAYILSMSREGKSINKKNKENDIELSNKNKTEKNIKNKTELSSIESNPRLNQIIFGDNIDCSELDNENNQTIDCEIDNKNYQAIDYNINYYQPKKKLFARKINRYICRIAEDLKIRQIKLHQVTVVLSMFTIVLIVISLTTNNIFAKEEKPEVKKFEEVEFEENENAIDLLEVLSDNISVTTRKDIIAEDGDIEYSIQYIENDKLPKGEEHIVEKGIKGKKETTYLRTYENEDMISEEIVGLLVLQTPKKEIIEIGTSEYLAKHKVHIGERMFLKEDAELKAYKSYNSETLDNVLVYLDVILLDIDGIWCKVQFDSKTGYLNGDCLVTENTMPGVMEISRKQRILSKVKYDMDVSKPTNMTKEDFKKLLTDEKDKNKVFENASDTFYDMEQKYGINGVFLAAVGIHESGWGTSKISLDKKNLFGYMAYDRDPYRYSANFETYEEGIETLAKVFCKYYLYPIGMQIYDGEISKGTYYNEPTVYGVNIRYASDKEWCNKVYNIMTYLYSKLP